MVRAECVRFLYDQAIAGLVVTVVVALVLGGILLGDARTGTVLAWWSVTAAIVAGRLWLVLRYRAAVDRDAQPARWANRFTLGTTLSGLAWGIGGASLASQTSGTHQMVITMTVTAMAVTAIPFLSAVMAAYAGYLLGAIGPLLLWLLLEWPVYGPLGGLAGVLILGAWAAASEFNGFLERTIELQLDNAKLADEQRDAAERLRESEARFRDFAETAADWLWEMDTDLRFTFVSDRVEAITGVPVDHHIGKSLEELAAESVDNSKWDLHRDDLAHHRAFREFRFLQRGGNGRLVEVFVSGKPVLDRDGTFRGYRGACRDVTEQTRLQNSVVRNERFAALGQLTGSVAHELRNPLGTVCTSLAVLIKLGPKDDLRLSKAIERIERNVARCVRIVSELLDFAQVRALTLTPAAIDDWLEDLLADYELPEGIVLRRRLEAGTEVAFDTESLRSAVVNLLDNACHAMTVTASRISGDSASAPTREPVLEVATRNRDGWLELSIHDTGSGMSEAVRGSAFEPLFTTKSFGVGLGLPIVRLTVERHGGSLVIDSEAARGTRVTIRLRH